MFVKIYYMSSTVLSLANIAVNKTGEVPVFTKLVF